jgi:predicted phosphoribosyltransferase
VISKSAAQKLSTEADELIAVLIPASFHGVGEFYEDFTQVSDDEVVACLQKLQELRKAG